MGDGVSAAGLAAVCRIIPCALFLLPRACGVGWGARTTYHRDVDVLEEVRQAARSRLAWTGWSAIESRVQGKFRLSLWQRQRGSAWISRLIRFSTLERRSLRQKSSSKSRRLQL